MRLALARSLSLLFLVSLNACTTLRVTSSPASLIVEPDDTRTPILNAIKNAQNTIRLTIYELTDLESVSPQAPAKSIVQALIKRANIPGMTVQVIVDQYQYQSGSNASALQKTVAALRTAHAQVKLSSRAFCNTHEKTFIIDGPTASKPNQPGTAIIMSLNLMPGYFTGTRDYGVITSDPGVVAEASRVFDSDFAVPYSPVECNPMRPAPPPSPSDTPAVSQNDLVWSPVNSQEKLGQLISSATQSLRLTTEELSDQGMICRIQQLAKSNKLTVQILLPGDTGVNASAVKTLLGLPNLTIRIMPGRPTPGDTSSPQTPLYMHGKQVIVDGHQAFVGSENLTPTSLTRNRELGILFTDSGMVKRLQQVFDHDFNHPGQSLPAQACTGGTGCASIQCND